MLTNQIYDLINNDNMCAWYRSIFMELTVTIVSLAVESADT